MGMHLRHHGIRVSTCALLALMISLSVAETGDSATGPEASPPGSGASFVPGEVIVRLKDAGGVSALSEGTDPAQGHTAALARLQAGYGLGSSRPVTNPLRHEPDYVLKTSRDVAALCAELNKDPEVQYAQPNYRYRICREPNDPEYVNQYAHQLIQMSRAWEISTGSRDVVIAVIGTGVDIEHPDLKANIWVNQEEIAGNGVDDDLNGYIDDVHGWNFGDSDSNVVPPRPDPEDPLSFLLSENGHETNVAGVIAGVGNNGIGVCGVNWQCSIMVLRLSMDYSSEEIAAALDYAAANGARIINMSFGGDEFGPEGDRLVRNAIDHAYAKGILLVASAGNSYTSRPEYPAAYYNVLAVSSTDGDDMKTEHSSFGPWVDIGAPGTDIVTTELGGDYISTAGTSFSSPYVAGVAGLLLAHRPQLTNVQLRALLENTTDPLNYGQVDPNVGYAGTGRVNAYQALLQADRDYPLGEIVTPGGRHTYAADGNAIALCLFVYGDSFQLDYRASGVPDWTTIGQGAAPADPNGFVCLSLANPGPGGYELRLRTMSGALTHTDRKVFDVEKASERAHWPKPAELESYASFAGSPLCLDVDGDGRPEIVQAAFGFDLGSILDPEGGFDPASDFLFGGMVGLWRADGTSLPNWPVWTDMNSPSSVAVGDIDGDGDYEVVSACEYEGVLYAHHVQTGQPVAGPWPVTVADWDSYDMIASGPVLADLNGDGKSEILISLDTWLSGNEGLILLRGDGTYLWKRRYSPDGPLSVGDLNKDGKIEIAVGGYGPGLDRPYTYILDGQGQQLARWAGSSPIGTAIADLEGDGTFEMVFSTGKEVMAVHADGKTVWKTKVADWVDMGGGLCVGDLDGDGHREVYVTTLVEEDGFFLTRVYGFDAKGRLLTEAGYPKTVVGDPSWSSPLMADIDGDSKKELLIAPGGEPLIGWKADGSVAPGLPLLALATDVAVTPAVGDLDRDGMLEIFFTGVDYQFHVVDLHVPCADDEIPWAMVRHDPQNSGWAVAAPKIEAAAFPTRVKAGQRTEIPLTATSPAGLPLRWVARNLPEEATFDATTATISWQPRADQAFQSHTFAIAVTDGVHQASRSASVEVVSGAIYYADMETDPNWTLDSYWAWGVPFPRGVTSEKHDPQSGHTGANALGCVLKGNYLNNMTETVYATTPAVDCRGYRNIRLCFWRWLTVDWPKDRVCLQVSKDGATWTDLWTPGASAVLDESWQFVSYAVPAEIGDDQPTVYFRWGLGPTNASINYGGWNIDDVQVTGDRLAP